MTTVTNGTITNVLASVLKRQKQWTLCVTAKKVNLQAELAQKVH